MFRILPFHSNPSLFIMVTARTNDACVEGFCPITRLRFLYSDVSETAALLNEQHNSDQAAAEILGRALAGIALVGIDLGEQDEMISMHTETAGPIGGYLVEMTGRGELRGYAYARRLPPPENNEPISPYGPMARVKMTRSHESGSIRSQMAFNVMPAGERDILMEFYNSTLQIPTQVCLHAHVFDGHLESVRALAVQRMPDGRKSDFARISALFKDGTVQEQLEFDASTATLREIFSLPELTTGPTRALRMGCTCSQASVDAAYASTPKDVLQGIARTGRNETFRCHLCGQTYTLTHEQIADFANQATPSE